MKTGSQKITVDGDEYDFYFSTKSMNKGQGITAKQGNKYYWNGKKVAANDEHADYTFFGLDSIDGTKAKYAMPGSEAVMGDIYKNPNNFSAWGAEVELTDGNKTGVKILAEKVALISKNGSISSSGTKKDGNGYKAIYKKGNGTAYWFITLD